MDYTINSMAWFRVEDCSASGFPASREKMDEAGVGINAIGDGNMVNKIICQFLCLPKEIVERKGSPESVPELLNSSSLRKQKELSWPLAFINQF